MNEKQLELMRSLVAAQAALWDVIDDPEIPSARGILAIIVARVRRLTHEIAGMEYPAEPPTLVEAPPTP